SGTWTALVDLAAVCAVVPAGNPTWQGVIAGNAPTDFAVALSWTGGQGTGHLHFHYRPGTGCDTVDTQGNGTNMTVYPPGSSTPIPMTGMAAVGPIHDTFSNGNWDIIAFNGCTGANCGEESVWQAFTTNIYDQTQV